eukprot:TRINITY_DN15080_c0_g2_i3.p1 TRINITY_DN15080_c0_g2~~TRINITY_DN15080_c0_g2_i3.p1  ORF type:complete len:692 (-),score=120.59 TRINITY_DN15080_c0_g2_i3:251-2326(-)
MTNHFARNLFEYLGIICGVHSFLWCAFIVWIQSVKLSKSHAEYLSAYTSLRMALLLWVNGTSVFYLLVSGVATDQVRIISFQTALMCLDLYLSCYSIVFLSVEVLSDAKMKRIKQGSLAVASCTALVTVPLSIMSTSVFICNDSADGGPDSTSYFWVVDGVPDTVRILICFYGIYKTCRRHRTPDAIDGVYSRVSSGPEWTNDGELILNPKSPRNLEATSGCATAANWAECWLPQCWRAERPDKLRRPGVYLLVLVLSYAVVDLGCAIGLDHFDDPPDSWDCRERFLWHIKKGSQFFFNILFPWIAWYTLACDREYWAYFTATLIREAEDPKLSRLPRQAMSKLKHYLLRSDDWVLGEELGGGCQATVYKAHLGAHPSHDTTIVSKVWELYDEKSGMGEMADGPKQAIREAALMLRSQHPHVVRLRGLSIDPPNISVLMEYCELGSLQSHLRTCTTLSFPLWQRIQVLFQISSAMHAMHSKGIAHRDLKWDNIMLVDDDGAPAAKVIDFGNARLLDRYSIRKYTPHVGTPAFCAPELSQDEGNYGLTVDVYSFGFLLWQTLANPSLEWAPSAGPRHFTRLEPARLHDGRPDLQFEASMMIPQTADGEPLTDGLISLIHRCWETSPERRPGFDTITYELSIVLLEFDETKERMLGRRSGLQRFSGDLMAQKTGWSAQVTQSFESSISDEVFD